jgi:hypothetical protein
MFRQAQPKHSYLPFGNRRVYSTTWLSKWVEYEREHATGYQGESLKCIRPYVDGKRMRQYIDTSRVHMDITHYSLDSYDPVHTDYMNSHYLNDISLKDLAHMPTNDFLRVIESLGHGSVSNGRTSGKRR